MEHTVSFSAALHEMLAHGSHIRRAGWPEGSEVYLDGSEIKSRTQVGETAWHVTHADLLAKDWTIVGEQLKSTFIPANA